MSTPNRPEEISPLVEKLFRHEYGKLTSALTRIFGTHQLELVEDVVQETLLKALAQWKFRGVPKSPTAWLFSVARNQVLDILRRQRHQKNFAQVSALLKSEYAVGATLDQLLSQKMIADEQLQMMFVCCHPALPQESQVALILKTLSGFSVPEISKAFLTNDEAVAKRIYRAKEILREEKISFELPSGEILESRLGTVQIAIYLIFSEGYHSSSHDHLIREDLVEEALRLALMLSEHPVTATPSTFALLALLCFQSARLTSRTDELTGLPLSLRDQDRSKWDQALVAKGIEFLSRASTGNAISRYHAEAAIAYEHCIATDLASTNWSRILQWYDWLLAHEPDPLIALNRLIALGEAHGPQKALEEVNQLVDKESLLLYPLFYSAQAHWWLQLNEQTKAIVLFQEALARSTSPMERAFLSAQISRCTR